MRPDVDSATSGTRGQCAAERRAVTNGVGKVRYYTSAYGVTLDRSPARFLLSVRVVAV